MQTRNALAAEGGDTATGGSRTGERDLVDARVPNQKLGDLAVCGHDVEDTRRQADVLGDLGEQVGAAWRLGRGLEDDGAPGEQRRGDLVRNEAEGRVPRDDRSDHADRFADEQAEFAPHGGLRTLLEWIRRREAGVEVEDAGHSARGVLGDGEEGARLAGPQLADFVPLASQAFAYRPQVLGALGV